MSGSGNTLKIGFVALMAAGLLSSAARAEYGSLGSYNSSVSSTLPQADSLLRPAGSAFGSSAKTAGSSDPNKAASDDLAATVDRAQKSIQRSQEESDLRGKVQKWNDDNDRKKIARTLPDILQANILKQREEEYQNAQKFFQQLQTAPGVSGADVNVSNLESSCRSGVDFQGFKTLADQMGREPFKFLRENGQKILEEKNKAVKEARIKNLGKLFDNMEKAQAKSLNADDFQADISKSGADPLTRDNSLNASIANLKFVLNAKKKEGGDLDRDLLKVTKEFATQALQADDNASKVQQLGAFFADNLDQYVQASIDSATAGAQALNKNCADNVQKLTQFDKKAPGGESQFSRAMREVGKANPDFANNQFRSFLTQVSGDNLRCTDAVGPIEDLYGPIKNVSAQVRTAKDPRALIAAAMSAQQAVAQANANVPQALQPLMSDCQYAAQLSNKFGTYIGQVAAQNNPQQQDQQQQPTSRRGRRGGRGGAAGSVAHSGSTGGRQTSNQ